MLDAERVVAGQDEHADAVFDGRYERLVDCVEQLDATEDCLLYRVFFSAIAGETEFGAHPGCCGM